MKIAFHFNADHETLNSYYGPPIKERVFTSLLEHRTININSKIFVGDLPFLMLASDTIEESETSTRHTFNQEKYYSIIHNWQNLDNFIWRRYSEGNLIESLNTNIYVICFESIDLRTAEYLNEELTNFPSYLGALEVDESSKTHWLLYANSLVPFGRIYDRKLNIFHQENDEIEDLMLGDYKMLGFKKVSPECLNWKYTIFDTFTGYEEARRISEWKRKSGALLAFISDDIVSRLSDIAPDIGNKLWSALQTFEDAETNEQLAQVTATCRRIFEYVTDCIFPPSDEKIDGHSLKADKYKNRLYAYADQSRQSSTNIDLIVATTQTLFEQWEKINNLSNKGVHSEVYRSETRRCLLRTIMLLDDIVSLKEKPFDIKPKIDFDNIFEN